MDPVTSYERVSRWRPDHDPGMSLAIPLLSKDHGVHVIRGDAQPRRLPVVDGLRAVAVASVLAFHFFPTVAPGGYIGVDIFFVISGFVIARRYLQTLVSGQTNFREFYVRRVQRLLPAYALVLASTLVASWFVLLPQEFKAFGESLAAQGLYLQNFVFWLQGDYFESAIQKPLLHTWSLAVEEQFYLLFPLLVLAFRKNRQFGVTLAVAALIGSLGLSMIVSELSPKTAFYLLPTRGWEFLAGVGAALVFDRVRIGRLSIPVFCVAVAALLWIPIAFDERAHVGGMNYLLAVGATVAICLVQRDIPETFSRLLANPAAQHVGNLSYSLYLWHWPLLSLWALRTGEAAGTLPSILLLVLAYVLALLSFTYIEKPALGWKPLRQLRPSLALLTTVCFVAFCSGVFIVLSRGALTRYPQELAVLHAAAMDRPPARCPYLARLIAYDKQVCALVSGDAGAVLLLGDSHAHIMKNELAAIAKRRGMSLYLTKQNCRPMDFEVDENCSAVVWRQITADVKSLGIDRVIVIGHYESELTASSYAKAVHRVMTLGVPVTFQKTVPTGKFFNPKRRAVGEFQHPPVSSDRYNRERATQDIAFGALAEQLRGRLRIVDPFPILCPTGRCPFAVDGRPLYIDDNHLSQVGRKRVATLYEMDFRRSGENRLELQT